MCLPVTAQSRFTNMNCMTSRDKTLVATTFKSALQCDFFFELYDLYKLNSQSDTNQSNFKQFKDNGKGK